MVAKSKAVRKVTNQTIELNVKQLKIIESESGKLTSDQLADFLGISRRTLFNILGRDKAANALYKKGRADTTRRIAGNLMTAAGAGDVTAMIFYLKCQGGWSSNPLLDDLNIKAKGLEIKQRELALIEKEQQIANTQLAQMNQLVRLKATGQFTDDQLRIMADSIE
jgi:DNA-binding CsgD family transcriptional regulator